MKLLCIIGDLDIGGAETFLMKVYRNLDRTKYQMDFLLFTSRECEYNKEVKLSGGRIYVATTKETDPFRSFSDIYRIVKENKYQNVLKVSEYSIGALDLLAAKLAGARIRAFRSTNGGSLESKKRILIHKSFIPFANMISTSLIAPSSDAAKFTFGNRAVRNNKVHYLNNGLLLEQYITNIDFQTDLQKELGLAGKYVVGHIGRFSEQKNHRFLVSIFYELKKTISNAVLVLVGDGELKEEIEEKINGLEIQDDVLFLGLRRDIPQLLSIMDVMVFPSLYEGMPNAVIEAQASGLPCVVSDRITREADITGIVSYVSLDDSIQSWISCIKNTKKKSIDECHYLLKKRGYDLADVCQRFIKLTYGEKNTLKMKLHMHSL